MQIGKHEFRKSDGSLILFTLFGIVISGFFIYSAVRTGFSAPFNFLAIALPILIIFLLRRFSKTDLTISDTGIDKIGIFGEVNSISWDNLINIQYKFLYRGKTSGNYFIIEYYANGQPTNIKLLASEYGNQKVTIARLFLEGGRNRITDFKLRELAARGDDNNDPSTPEPKTPEELAKEKEESEYNNRLGKVGKIVVAIVVAIVIFRVIQEVMK